MRSFFHIFFIFLFIFFQDFFNRSEHSFKCISFDINQANRGLTLYASFSSAISNQSDLPKIVTLLVLEDCFRFLFSDQFPFHHHIKLATFLTLFNNIVSLIECLFPKNVAELLLLVGVNL